MTVALGRVQLGKETTKGTAVAATARLMGTYTAAWGAGELNVDQPSELRGDLVAAHRGDILGKAAQLRLDGELVFQDLLFFLQSGLVGGITPTGAGADKTWVFDPSLTSVPSIDSYTVECGDDVLAERAEYCLTQDFELSWGVQSRSPFRANLFGRQWTAQAFTALGSPQRDVVPVLGQNWRVYLDNAGGAHGATEYTGCFRGVTFQSGPLWKPFWCAKGTTFNNHVKPKLAPSVRLRVAVDSALAALRAKARAGTRQLVRLENTGPALGGSTYKLTIDLAARIMDTGEIGGTAEDETYISEIPLMGEYDPTWAKVLRVTVVNDLAAMP